MTNDANEESPGPSNELEQRQADAIFRIAADLAFDRLDPADPRNARFFEWLATETRERQTPDERAETERESREFARRLTRRWRTDVVEVEDAPGAVPRREAPVETSTGQALELAVDANHAPFVDLAVAAGEGRELWDEECTEWIELPPALPKGRYLGLRVSGDSMRPLLESGDTILVRLNERNERLEPGRVVVARRPDSGYVVKRLGRVAPREIELLSLNPAFPPVRIPRRTDTVLGTVVIRWHAEGASSQ
jgi:phage repressor protein C with HTH and peptisase S24 domain